jgi:hypothetical protein
LHTLGLGFHESGTGNDARELAAFRRGCSTFRRSMGEESVMVDGLVNAARFALDIGPGQTG